MTQTKLHNWHICDRRGSEVDWAGFPLTPSGANAARMWFARYCQENPDSDPQLIPPHSTRYPAWLREDTLISREAVVNFLTGYIAFNDIATDDAITSFIQEANPPISNPEEITVQVLADLKRDDVIRYEVIRKNYMGVGGWVFSDAFLEGLPKADTVSHPFRAIQ